MKQNLITICIPLWGIGSNLLGPVLNHLPLDKMAAILADDTFKHIFLNEDVRISIKISLKFVPKSPINNNPALVQIMAWRRSGDKPLSEPMMVSLLTHICVTWPLSVNSSPTGQNDRQFSRQHFQMHFLEWKWQNSDSNFTEIYSQEFNWQEAIIGSGNCLAPNRWQAITWTNDDPFQWRIYVVLGGNELI